MLSPVLKYAAPLLICRLFVVFVLSVADCDEVFNFLEPLHLMIYGGGLQTWEYSPEFSMRSWIYLIGHAVFVSPAVHAGLPPVYIFFLLRVAVVCLAVACEATLLVAVARHIHPKVAATACLLLAVSPGSLSQSIAVLPSSFAAAALSLVYAAAVPATTTRHAARAAILPIVAAAGAAATFGWPFAAPCAFPAAALAFRGGIFRTLAVAVTVAAAFVAVSTAVDTAFYVPAATATSPGAAAGSVVSSVVNLILYNAVKAPAGGSQLYGVEPPSWYVKNLALCFPVTFLLALLAPLVAIVEFAAGSGTAARRRAAAVAGGALAPMILWVAAMSAQPHKEERFMAPVYVCICIAAAYTIAVVGGWVHAGVRCVKRDGRGASDGDGGAETAVLRGGATTTTTTRRVAGKAATTSPAAATPPTTTTASSTSPSPLRSRTAVLLVALCVMLSLARTATLSLYGAPLHAWAAAAASPPAAALAAAAAAAGSGAAPPTICVGREWYRFPSSFHTHPVPLSTAAVDALRAAAAVAGGADRSSSHLTQRLRAPRVNVTAAVAAVQQAAGTAQRRYVGDVTAARALAPPTALAAAAMSIVSLLSPHTTTTTTTTLTTDVADYAAAPFLEVLFIDDGFGGQLPRPFWPPALPTAASAAHPDFSNLNTRDASRFVPLSACDFVVESALHGDAADSPTAATRTWRKVVDLPFLDSGATRAVARILSVPWSLQRFLPAALRVAVGRYYVAISPQADAAAAEALQIIQAHAARV